MFWGKFATPSPLRLGFCALALLVSLPSCNEVDDQRLLPASSADTFNPIPADFDPQLQAKHQVLIAIVDTGVDYLHPKLKRHIHFELDQDGKPIGSGYDFIGKDRWSLPYLGRTEALRPTATEALLAEEKGWAEGIDYVTSVRPEYSKFLNRLRLHKFEAKMSIFHGTHVAGLASYDDERIGLLPYRVLPFNRETAPEFDYEKKFVQDLVAAFDHAEKAGAKVVNLSIGTSFKRNDPNFERLRRYEQLFADAVRSKPQMVFVAAAGNDSSWVDGQSRFSYPCGIQAKNLLCVAALKADGNLADFTNIPLIQSPLIFTLGTDVLSTHPTQFCASDALTQLDTASESWMTRQGNASELEAYRRRLLDRIASGCTVIPSYSKQSGTSMASPIVARLLARLAIDLPDATGEELIQRLSDSAERSSIGPLPILKLKAQLPSWYAETGSDPRPVGETFHFATTPSQLKTRF